jgi:3-(3-hydroxy-phenyl)propionate hydroxylase
MTETHFQVAIVGAGPVGLTLANLLGVYGIRTVVLERNASTVEEPRAIAIDAESLRTMQAAGLYETVAADMLLGLRADYVNGSGKPLMSIELGETPYGHALQNSFDQPLLERQLFEGLGRFAHCEVRFRHQVEGVDQSWDSATVRGVTEEGKPFAIGAKYVIGCDGGRSTVRQHLDIAMQGTTAPQRWLVIDTVDPQLDDAFACRFFCNPGRPGMTLKKRHQKRRWEWMLLPGELDGDLLEDDRIAALIAPYTDPAQVRIERKCVYTFHSIVADRYRDGRILIAGDAAHMMPPFAGQGMNGGLRDARNLSWKLALVLDGLAGEGLLDTYEIERRDHVIEATRLANRLGDFIQPTNTLRAWLRDLFFAGIQTVPGAQGWLDRTLSATLRAPRLPAGTFVPGGGSDSVAGDMIVQPPVTLQNGDLCPLDELLGTGFAVLGVGADPSAALDAATREAWQALGARFVHVQRTGPVASPDGAIDHTGKLTHWLQGSAAHFLAIRPDRFVVAQFAADDARAATREAIALLTMPGEGA